MFRFKQFSVCQDRTAMKVGTDGVLLGAWCDVTNDRRVLDIGTGTGLISLMIAQRCDAMIDGIEIETNAYEQTVENFNASPWNTRLTAYHTPLLCFSDSCTETYTHIVSNPPYFKKSLPPPGRERSMARHDHSLPFDQLIECGSRLLAPEGKLSLIIPYSEVDFITLLAQKAELPLYRLTKVVTRLGLPPKRALVEYRKYPSGTLLPTPVESELQIELSGRNDFSLPYIELTREFYLNM